MAPFFLEFDPHLCRRWGGEIKFVSFITETDVVRKILTHLELWKERTPVERPPPVKIHKRHYEPFDDGWLDTKWTSPVSGETANKLIRKNVGFGRFMGQ